MAVMSMAMSGQINALAAKGGFKMARIAIVNGRLFDPANGLDKRVISTSRVIA